MKVLETPIFIRRPIDDLAATLPAGFSVRKEVAESDVVYYIDAKQLGGPRFGLAVDLDAPNGKDWTQLLTASDDIQTIAGVLSFLKIDPDEVLAATDWDGNPLIELDDVKWLILTKAAEETLNAAGKRSVDRLTGLHNRRALVDLSQQLIARALSHQQSLSILLADVDKLKHVNDAHGHQVGDQLIRGLAARFEQAMEATYFTSRIAGDEFVVVMPGTDAAEAARFGEHLRAAVAGTAFQLAQDTVVNVTVSVGVASLNQAVQTMDELLQQAEAALRQAKITGNRVVALAA